jgi:hypothetical protein
LGQIPQIGAELDNCAPIVRRRRRSWSILLQREHSTIEEAVAPARHGFSSNGEVGRNLFVPKAISGAWHDPRPGLLPQDHVLIGI